MRTAGCSQLRWSLTALEPPFPALLSHSRRLSRGFFVWLGKALSQRRCQIASVTGRRLRSRNVLGDSGNLEAVLISRQVRK